jgi:hypothetical protein
MLTISRLRFLSALRPNAGMSAKPLRQVFIAAETK